MNHIFTYELFEAAETSSTDGLSEFIRTIDAKFPNTEGLLQDLAKFITESNCPAIKFDNLYGALGISKTDECIIGNSALNRDIGNLLYVILHEVAHQYQYKKYGKDVVWDAYNSNMDIDEAVDLLMNIELVADRFSYLKTKSMLRDHGIKNNLPISTYYDNMSKGYYKLHLEDLRNTVKEKGFTSVEQINEYLYNELKVKPKPIVMPNKPFSSSTGYQTSFNFKTQSNIDKILDKLSAGGWSSLTEPEKNTLRAASKK